MSRKYEVAQQYLCHSLRNYMYNNIKQYPWHYYLRVVYNDALTYNPQTKEGGYKAHFKYPQIARATQNKEMQGFINELIYLKSQEDIVLDKLSISDYFAAAAYIAIKEMEGPNIIPEI